MFEALLLNSFIFDYILTIFWRIHIYSVLLQLIFENWRQEKWEILVKFRGVSRFCWKAPIFRVNFC